MSPNYGPPVVLGPKYFLLPATLEKSPDEIEALRRLLAGCVSRAYGCGRAEALSRGDGKLYVKFSRG